MKHMKFLVMAFSLLCGCGTQNSTPSSAPPDVVVPVPVAPEPLKEARDSEIPSYVYKTLAHIRETGKAPEGYEGGRHFMNAEKLLPQSDSSGRKIRYTEWDVNPRGDHNRGAERLVTGSDDSAWFTSDHYRTFKRMP